ncbi:hypothetical protein F4W66_24665 (plasmid) [Escherichia coli]|nr:hypothetical protein F4W66_24665 [Escherichia coli]
MSIIYVDEGTVDTSSVPPGSSADYKRIHLRARRAERRTNLFIARRHRFHHARKWLKVIVKGSALAANNSDNLPSVFMTKLKKSTARVPA